MATRASSSRRLGLGLLLSALLVLAVVTGAAAQKKGKSVKKQLDGGPGGGEPGPEVSLPLGSARGLWLSTRGGRRVAAFTSLPYAQPPIDDLRFKGPRPPQAWQGVRDSTPLSLVPQCMQPKETAAGFSEDLVGVEDCLYLNVFSPNMAVESNLPVLVYIHGGAFSVDSSSRYGPEYLLDRDVVLVTLNYRLGALGFLSTEDKECPGNFGLKDQSMALKWVQEHIKHFGGNPDLVTIFGQSAGGISTHLHLASPRSRGLFHRAISQSGTAMFPTLPPSRGVALKRAQHVSTTVGCPTDPSWKLVECLRKKPAQELVRLDASMREWWFSPALLFGPVLEDFVVDTKQYDEPFLDEEPSATFSRGLGHDVPWMSGITSAEGAAWVAAMLRTARQVEAFDYDFERLAPLVLEYRDTAPDPNEVTAEVKDFYFGSGNITVSQQNKLVEMISDALFLGPLDESMRLQAAFAAAPAFMYLFNHRGKRSFTDSTGSPDFGVSHSDELMYLFPLADLFETDLDPVDRKVSDQMIDLWVNFARTGNPTPEGDERYSFPWKPVSSNDLEFVEVGPGGRLLKGAGLLGHRAHFWAALPISERHLHSMRASMPARQEHDEF